MKYSLTSRIAGAALAVFSAQQADAQDTGLTEHYGLFYNGQISNVVYYQDAPSGVAALQPGQNADNFAASFLFATRDGAYSSGAVCSYLTKNTLEQNVATYIQELETTGSLNEQSRHVTYNAMRAAMEHCPR